MNLREAAEMALKVLTDYVEDPRCQKEIDQVAEALRQALAQPVDAVNISTECVDETVKREHEWVGLTDDDIHDAFNYVEMVKLLDFDRDRPEWCEAFARACEARLRHRNGEKQ